ncbi:putative WD repeat-containing protein [Wickerhamomyces ciferrii]|uniref:Ribosome biogenesis protein NSA1 n=1 Tax=Wickerhamomyces ciferrii (strain ATCC 14091 / BCRC 22168 / CBS 111 / JCM 3599 / NBRC 0793 / NRRL Y-1031 F-60-10) TaxID=1206466 RepID=K0KYM4_WICCF|nr:putative WD repeat-containing protein [Wickerhamomyces ciferrii]CCH46178.1 putative WD repeat-containing protein [Wickerhamomyces ciferrii]
MKVLAAADDTGSLKEITFPKGTDTSSQKAPQPEKIETYNNEGLKNRVQRFLITSANENEVIATARANGNIVFYNSENYELINTILNPFDSSIKDQFVSLINASGYLYAVSEQGRVTIIDPDTIFEDKINYKNLTIKAPISTFVSHPTQEGLFAFGGKENDVKLIKFFKDGETPFDKKELKVETVFQGKNVKNDKLDLRVPIWITNISFIKLEEHTESSWKFITTTGHGQVRKYDTSHGRKPVLDKKISDKPLVRVVTTSKEDEIICADTHVTTALFNVEKGNLIAKFKGNVGAVEALSSHITEDSELLVTGALDRYIRIFDIRSREQVAKIYIGSKISAVWLLSDEETEGEIKIRTDAEKTKKKSRKQIEQEDEGNEDEVWDELDKIEKKSTKKRRV